MEILESQPVFQIDHLNLAEILPKLLNILEMDKIWNPQAWPKPIHQHRPVYPQIQSESYTLTQHTFPSKFIEYLINICYEKQAPVEVIQLTLSIASRYMIKNSIYNEPTQLILLTSLFLAGKVLGNCDGSWGGFNINQIHKYSNHCFTNKDFYRIEKKILEEIKFDILAEGVCDRQVKTVLLMLREILTESYYRMLCKITEDMQIMVWHHLFTKGEKDKLLKRSEKMSENKFQRMLTAAIIQAGFVLSTHCVGRFPATVWMIHALDLKEDQLSLLVEDVLKIVLGRQKFQQLKI